MIYQFTPIGVVNLGTSKSQVPIVRLGHRVCNNPHLIPLLLLHSLVLDKVNAGFSIRKKKKANEPFSGFWQSPHVDTIAEYHI